jgi:short-subunit dehydrogenase
MLKVNKKTVLITGANGDIAQALIGKISLDPRYELILHFKNKNSYFQYIKRNGKFNYKYFLIDFNNLSNIKKKLSKLTFKADILINNVGNYETEFFLDSKIENILNQININYLSLLIVMHHFAKIMGSNNGGQIINYSSGSGSHGGVLPSFGYASSKNSINFMTKILAKELKNSKIKINTIMLRYVETKMLKKFRNSYKKLLNENIKIELPIKSSQEVADFTIKIIGNNKIKSGRVIELK